MPKKKIHIHASVSEANEAQAKYALNQEPLERIREVVQLILRVFPADEKKPNTNRIYIDKA